MKKQGKKILGSFGENGFLQRSSEKVQYKYLNVEIHRHTEINIHVSVNIKIQYALETIDWGESQYILMFTTTKSITT